MYRHVSDTFMTVSTCISVSQSVLDVSNLTVNFKQAAVADLRITSIRKIYPGYKIGRQFRCFR